MPTMFTDLRFSKIPLSSVGRISPNLKADSASGSTWTVIFEFGRFRNFSMHSRACFKSTRSRMVRLSKSVPTSQRCLCVYPNCGHR